MPKLLYLATEDWAFCQHFLPMARAAREGGFDVVVAARLRNHRTRIEAEGCRAVSLENERRSLGPLEAAGSVARMIRIVRAEKPDIVHCISLRMVVLGGVAAKLAGAKSLVLAPTGLGHLWIAHGLLERIVRTVARVAVKWLRGPRTQFIFENPDDPKEFGLDPAGPEVTLVGGAGVSPADFSPSPQPPPPVKAAVVSRMLAPKGIAETVEAVLAARKAGAALELHLFGTPDPSNRTTLAESDLRTWSRQQGVHWHGAAADVSKVWRDHHIAVLLSYREGLPRSLVEAAASARPILTADVPGCREVVRDGVEGLLVPLGDIAAAAAALVRLAKDAALRERLGSAAHARFLDRFTEQKVKEAVRALYRRMLDRG